MAAGPAGRDREVEAGPHQYSAVTRAVGSTIQAVESNGKAGVAWYTQGSGKSMEMEPYTNRLIHHPRLKNPTVVVITDRNELDGQLIETFLQSHLLPEKPQQIRRRAELRDELSNRTTGGTCFTTLQKFSRSQAEKEAGTDHPLLSDRRNIIVVVDEAHPGGHKATAPVQRVVTRYVGAGVVQPLLTSLGQLVIPSQPDTALCLQIHQSQGLGESWG